MKDRKRYEKIQWTDKYSSGLIYLDNHRRNFIDILNELVEIVNEDNCESMLPIIFHRLAFYAEDFFAKKEMAMTSVEGLSINVYRAEHDRFTNAVARFHDDFRRGQKDVCLEFYLFLKEWFDNYVSIFGADEAEFLKEKGYE